jgi:hypothetical protein
MNKIRILVQNRAILFLKASYTLLQAIKTPNEKVGVNFE